MMTSKVMRKPIKKNTNRGFGNRKSSRNTSNVSGKNANKSKLNVTGGQGSSSNEQHSKVLPTGNNSSVTKNRQVKEASPMIVNESSTNEDENELLNLNNSNDLSDDRTHDYSPTAKIVKLQNYPNSDNLLIQKKLNQ